MTRGFPLIGFCFVAYSCIALCVAPDALPWHQMPTLAEPWREAFGMPWRAMTGDDCFHALTLMLLLIDLLLGHRMARDLRGLGWSFLISLASVALLCSKDGFCNPCFLQFTLAALIDLSVRFGMALTRYDGNRAPLVFIDPCGRA